MGDTNGDGYGDVVLDGLPTPSRGRGNVYVLWGGLSFNTSSVADADITIRGDRTDDWFGFVVQNLGDVNQDGADDLGATSASAGSDLSSSYLFWGPLTAAATLGSTADADVMMNADGRTDAVLHHQYRLRRRPCRTSSWAPPAAPTTRAVLRERCGLRPAPPHPHPQSKYPIACSMFASSSVSEPSSSTSTSARPPRSPPGPPQAHRATRPGRRAGPAPTQESRPQASSRASTGASAGGRPPGCVRRGRSAGRRAPRCRRPCGVRWSFQRPWRTPRTLPRAPRR